jgi:uncharacterized integral membrane protein
VSDPERAEAGRDEPRSARERQLRLGGSAALAVLALVFVIQNSGTTEITLLWWSVRMPLFIVLLAMIGAGVGLDRAWIWRRNRR